MASKTEVNISIFLPGLLLLHLQWKNSLNSHTLKTMQNSLQAKKKKISSILAWGIPMARSHRVTDNVMTAMFANPQANRICSQKGPKLAKVGT